MPPLPVAKGCINKKPAFPPDGKKETTEEQVNRMLKMIQDELLAQLASVEGVKGVALTYSANLGQANELRKGYEGSPAEPISGDGQAKVFAALQQKIKELGWDNVVHILPVATSREGGKDYTGPDPNTPDGKDFIPKNDEQLSDNMVVWENVQTDMCTIAQHLAAGVTVFGFTRRPKAGGEEFNIGGGYSKSWCVQELGGQGPFAQEMMRIMAMPGFADYAENFETPRSELTKDGQEVQSAIMEGSVIKFPVDDTPPKTFPGFIKCMETVINKYMDVKNDHVAFPQNTGAKKRDDFKSPEDFKFEPLPVAPAPAAPAPAPVKDAAAADDAGVPAAEFKELPRTQMLTSYIEEQKKKIENGIKGADDAEAPEFPEADGISIDLKHFARIKTANQGWIEEANKLSAFLTPDGTSFTDPEIVKKYEGVGTTEEKRFRLQEMVYKVKLYRGMLFEEIKDASGAVTGYRVTKPGADPTQPRRNILEARMVNDGSGRPRVKVKINERSVESIYLTLHQIYLHAQQAGITHMTVNCGDVDQPAYALAMYKAALDMGFAANIKPETLNKIQSEPKFKGLNDEYMKYENEKGKAARERVAAGGKLTKEDDAETADGGGENPKKDEAVPPRAALE